MSAVTARPLTTGEIKSSIQYVQTHAKSSLDNLQNKINEQREIQAKNLCVLNEKERVLDKKIVSSAEQIAKAQQEKAAAQQKIIAGQQKIAESQKMDAEAEFKLKTIKTKRFCESFSPQTLIKPEEVFVKYLDNDSIIPVKINEKNFLKIKSASIINYLEDHPKTKQCNFHSSFRFDDVKTLTEYLHKKNLNFTNLN